MPLPAYNAYWPFVLVLGLLWGSFVLVVSDRIDSPKTIIYGRSHCPKCKRAIAPYDLIPVLSFLFLFGRCRGCKKPIGWIYPAVELLFALLFSLSFWRFGLLFSQIPLVLSVSLLVIAALRDIKDKEVELAVFIIGIPLATVWFLMQSGFNWPSLKGLFISVLIAAFLPSLFAVLSSQKWMGYGDILFALWVGALCGYPAVVVALFFAFLCGSLFGIIQIVTGKAQMKTAIPFGPFLALGSLVGLFFGQELFSSYLKLFGL